MTEVAALGLRVEGVGGIEKASDALDNLTKSGNSAEKSIDSVGRSSSVAASYVGKLAAAATAAFSVSSIARYADKWSDLTSIVDVNISSQSDVTAVMDRLSDTARQTYSDLGRTAEAFAQNASTLNALGKSTLQQLNYTEALNNALVVSGAKSERAALVQNALARAMSEGSAKGEDLNLILNYGSRVAELLADELGVNVTQLRQMAAQGKITGDVIYNALVNNMEILSEQAESMPATMADGFILIQNSLLQAVGAYDQANKISESLAENLVAIADAIRDTDFEPYINGLTIAAKVYAAYLVTTKAIPAATALATTAQAIYTKAMAAFTVQTAAANAQLTAQQVALGRVQKGLNIAAAAYIGWEIGTYLRNEFEIVEKAGIAMAGGMHSVAIRIAGFFELLGADIKYAISNPIDFIRGVIADFLEWTGSLSKGTLEFLGMDGLAASVQTEFSAVRGVTSGEHQKTLSDIRNNTQRSLNEMNAIYAEMFASVGESSKKASGTISDVGEVIDVQTAAQAKALQALNNQYLTTYDSLRRQLLLSKEATEIEKIRYELEYGNLKGLSPDRQQMLSDLASEVDLKNKILELDKTAKDVSQVMREISSGDGANEEIARLNQQYEARKEILDNALETEYLTQLGHDQAMLALEQATAAERDKIRQASREKEQQATLDTMSNIVSITQAQTQQMRDIAGESTAVGKTFFVASQALAAANSVIYGIQSAMAIRTAYAQMAAMAGTGAPAILSAGEIHAGIAQGMGIANAALIAAQTVSGFKQGGYTGNTGVNEIAGVVHGREYVFDAASTARIGANNLEAMRQGKMPQQSPNVQIINNGAPVSARTEYDGDQLKVILDMAEDRIANSMIRGGKISKATQASFGVQRAAR